MQTFSRELRSMPIWLLREYLQELGGEESGPGRLRGNGWEACLTQIEDFALGSLRVGQIRIDWQGNERAVEEIWPKLEKKLARAGG